MADYQVSTSHVFGQRLLVLVQFHLQPRGRGQLWLEHATPNLHRKLVVALFQ